MTDEEIDFLLKRFDLTEPCLQRKIVAKAFAELLTAQDEIKRLRKELEGCWSGPRVRARSD